MIGSKENKVSIGLYPERNPRRETSGVKFPPIGSDEPIETTLSAGKVRLDDVRVTHTQLQQATDIVYSPDITFLQKARKFLRL